jgi:hypothetical protein
MATINENIFTHRLKMRLLKNSSRQGVYLVASTPSTKTWR